MGLIRLVRRSLNSIGTRVMLVVVVAGVVTAAVATAFVTREMYSSAESGLVDDVMSTGTRTRDAVAARLEVVDVELLAAARLLEAGRPISIREILSPFVVAARVERDGEVIELVRVEAARKILDGPGDVHRQIVGGFLRVHALTDGVDLLAVVDMSDFITASEASRTWIGPREIRSTGAFTPGLTVSRESGSDGEVAIARAPVDDTIDVYHEASLAPAKAAVDRSVRNAVGYAAVVSLSLLMGIAWALARGVTRPVRELAQSVRDSTASPGTLEHPDNEIGELGAAISHLREDLARDARLLQASAQLAQAIVHIKEPDAALALLQRALDEAHQHDHWRVLSIYELEAGAVAGIDLELLRFEAGRTSAGSARTSAHGTLVTLVADGTLHGVLIAAGPASEVDLRHVQALGQSVVTAIRGMGLAELATVNEKLAVIGRLSASIAHEMNNPLAYMLVNLEMLEEKLDGDSLALATDARVGVERLSSIVRDLSRMSRGGSEQQGRVDLAEVARVQVQIAQGRARRVEIELNADQPVWAICASGSIGQAVLNLVVNAMDAVRARPAPRVVVSVVATGTVATITVSDNGEGIPLSTQRRLFDAFFTTKGEAGTGLGLHLSRGFARSHGGDLALVATGEDGTTFRLSLPTQAAAELAPAPAVEPGRANVLVLDDEPLIVRMIERQLASVADVVGTTDPRVALQAAASQAFTLVLCDWNMPLMSGAEFLDELRRSCPNNARRCVVMTGGQLPVMEGVTVLAKPVSGDVMRRLVHG